MYTAPFGRDVNYLGNQSEVYTPNRATYLFTLIHAYRVEGLAYADALAKARSVLSLI